ncbi:hypothetical protein SAMN05216196_10818 [Lutimaribacter pacificus]|uniref:Uncharacterized protein n=1 Tax=Lutimaribacter pacificus TaxID=391948 RepID=A0A1H0LIZ3_9RHOB|nr:hypothetical protein [Lutimaribacter pacificus]SDO68134.1 hypothetical protein SAMN05216196_10818 [Lutimaribacter pacificus]SHK06607.1 hypothetical protein SAMN05444142_103139 [Lutimaribacter pacificus]
MKKGDAQDPKGLIFESYRIEGITEPECRTIFLDWALSLPDGQDSHAALQALIARYGADAPDHPMTQVMRAGLDGMGKPRRRGGAGARPRGQG